MIQTILLFTLRPGVTGEQIEALRAGLVAIPLAPIMDRRERCQIRI